MQSKKRHHSVEAVPRLGEIARAEIERRTADYGSKSVRGGLTRRALADRGESLRRHDLRGTVATKFYLAGLYSHHREIGG